MKQIIFSYFCITAALNAAETLEDDPIELTDFVIKEQQTANIMPVATYDTPVSNLEFNPRIDFQSRNMAEAQGDVTIRGGIFENTGFRVGSATLVDPQTGHYFAEIPIAPEMLTSPEVLVAGGNALYGFNSTVGTISYGWTKIENGGSLTVGGGDNDLNFQRIHHALRSQFGDSTKWSWGAEVEYSRSESDGTIQYGDHDFERTTGRIQLVGPNSQTDFFAGYQAKFFGWPNMYTPFGVNETENLKTSLFIIDHMQRYADRSYIEATAYYRENKDHYIYSRENPSIFEAKHTTDMTALGFSGLHAFDEQFGINYAGQLAADEIESTSLELGEFQSRTYYKLSLLPEYRIGLKSDEYLIFRVGGSFDDTNRNDSELSFIGDITWERDHIDGTSESIYLSYAESSQVVGYTAIGGRTFNFANPPGRQPLFASNPNLNRETSRNIELGGTFKRKNLALEAALFYRWDDDLADWVFSDTRNTARVALPVDVETFGVELIATRRWNDIEAIVSYTYLSKDEDYGDTGIAGIGIDASFYALNYAKHRATLGLIWTPIDMIKISIDNEWRSQRKNMLRTSDDEAFFTQATLTIYPPNIEDLELFASIDNAWDDDFEEVPGTPGRGDQVAVGATYRW